MLLLIMVYQKGQKHRYGSTRISDPYFRIIRVDPYICGYFTGLLAFTGRPVIYGSTRISRVDPYLKYGSTRKYTGRPVKIRVNPYFKNTGRPVKYGSTCNLRVDPYFPLNKLTNQEMAFIGFSAPLKYRLKSCCGVVQLLPV